MKKIKQLENELIKVIGEEVRLKEEIENIKNKELYPQLVKKHRGKLYRVRNNYSLPEKQSDYWWTYLYIIKLSKDCNYFSGVQFEIDKDGRVDIHAHDLYNINTLTRYKLVDIKDGIVLLDKMITIIRALQNNIRSHR